jgi:enterochelin esterase-like enzyme
MDSLGDWAWPGQGGAAAVEMLPPAWVPTFPPRREAPSAPAERGGRTRTVLLGGVLSALGAICVMLALHGQLEVERVLGIRSSPRPTATVSAPAATAASLPTLKLLSTDAAGSMILRADYPSAALHGAGSFTVYLPPGYASTSRRYPVLYLLHGNDQQATAFLEIGLQEQLDQLIARHAIGPIIAVMIQGGRGANNWHNVGHRGYESYVLEVQELIDRTLPTMAARDARAIAGDSMGGYGAMNIALGNPYRFGTVESWLGFFNGLEGELHADRPVLKRLGLRAFVYGGESDHIADPAEDAPFAAALRANGARAKSAVYPGEHTLETLEAHLTSMLTFAGHAIGETPAHGVG